MAEVDVRHGILFNLAHLSSESPATGDTHSSLRAHHQPARTLRRRPRRQRAELVRPTANGRWSKTWSQRVKIGGRLTNVGLGSYPVITLAEARARALENARAVAVGKDPRSGDAPTVAEAWEEVI